MANIPAKLPFVLNYTQQPFYNPELFPNNVYSRLHPQQLSNPIDMQTLGMISAMAPQLRQLDPFKEDLAHLPSTAVHKKKHHDFQIYLDVGLFAPEELSVKIVDDHVVIEGKHEERQAHDAGFVTRHFTRRYQLPKGYNPDALVSKLSSDGVLSVVLPKPTHKPEERIVPIQPAGPNDVFFKKNKSKQIDCDKCAKNEDNGVEIEVEKEDKKE